MLHIKNGFCIEKLQDGLVRITTRKSSSGQQAGSYEDGGIVLSEIILSIEEWKAANLEATKGKPEVTPVPVLRPPADPPARQ